MRYVLGAALAALLMALSVHAYIHYLPEYGFQSGDDEKRFAIRCHHCGLDVRETGKPSRFCPQCKGELAEFYWIGRPTVEEWMEEQRLLKEGIKPEPRAELMEN